MSKNEIDLQIIEETPPHNLEAERTILGSILVDSKNLDKVLSIILPGDFYSEANRTIFSAMIVLRNSNKPIDTLVLTDLLDKTKLLDEVGGVSYISRLMDGVPRSSNVKYYARMVKAGSIYRQIIHVAAKAIASTYGQDGDPTQVIGKLRVAMDGLDSEARRIKAPTQSLSEYLREKQGIESKRKLDHLLGYRLNGFPEIARNIDGLQSGLYLIGAYTNKGKTATLTSLFLDALSSNPEITAMFFSLDDNKNTIINRLLSTRAGIDINKVQREQVEPKDRDRLKEAYDYIVGLADEERIIIKDIEEINHVDSVEAEIRERVNDHPVVFIDDVYNLDTGVSYNGLREENVDRAIKIKKLVEIHDLPIVGTAELRKKSAGESMGRKPNINDFMETGKFGYKADIAWLLYPEGKDEVFDKEPKPTLVLDYVKNKLSSFTGTQNLVFTKAQGTIREEGGGETGGGKEGI